ncbi:MAG: hypothetical protein K5705_05870 [Oscillospiraceae bacterium]|nr:hypothetical protein [Oscillospiraceae bacterium]
MLRTKQIITISLALSSFFLTACGSTQQLIDTDTIEEAGKPNDFDLNERYDFTFFYIDTKNDIQNPFLLIPTSTGSLIATE